MSGVQNNIIQGVPKTGSRLEMCLVQACNIGEAKTTLACIGDIEVSLGVNVDILDREVDGPGFILTCKL